MIYKRTSFNITKTGSKKKYKEFLQQVNKLLLNVWELFNKNWQQIHNTYRYRIELNILQIIR